MKVNDTELVMICAEMKGALKAIHHFSETAPGVKEHIGELLRKYDAYWEKKDAEIVSSFTSL